MAAMWWSVKFPLKYKPTPWPVYVVKAFLSCCQQHWKCLASFLFILQLPETKQLLRLRQYAHGTTALIFLTALSGKALSAVHFVTHSSLLVWFFLLFCEQPHPFPGKTAAVRDLTVKNLLTGLGRWRGTFQASCAG